MSAGEFARDGFGGEPPLPPLEKVPTEPFRLPGTRGLRWRARFWVATCGPTSRPRLALLLCLTGIVGMFLPVTTAANGHGWTPLELAGGPSALALCLFAVLTVLPVVDLAIGRERLTPWLAFPAALGLQVTLALLVVVGSQGPGALHPRLSEGVHGLGVGAVLLLGVELGLAVVGGFGFARRAARRSQVSRGS